MKKLKVKILKMKIKNSRERKIWIDGLFNGALIIGLVILSSKFFLKAMTPNEISIWVNLISGFLGLLMIIFVILIFIKFWRIVNNELKSSKRI